MGFGKVVLGALLVAIGLVLLGSLTGYLPPDIATSLLPFWPILLVAFGIAFLGNALKNALLGWLAALVVLVGIGFGVYWIGQHRREAEPRYRAAVNLTARKVELLTLKAQVLGGKLDVDAAPAGKVRLATLEVRHVPGRGESAHRFATAGRSGILTWPAETGWSRAAPVGAALHVRLPEGFPLRLDGRCTFSSSRLDLSKLRPERVVLDAVASTVRCAVGDRGRPRRIVIQGFLSSTHLRIPGDCPVRLSFTSRLGTLRTVPSDFVEHAPGRGHGVVYTAEGRGPLIEIYVDGPLHRVTVERESLSAV